MNLQELTALLDRLRAEPRESEWLEFKAHQPVTREDIDRLLLDKLPEVLDEAQKHNRIHYLLGKLAQKGRIRNEGSRKFPRWVLMNG